jgi:hypothetical protein
MARPFRIGATGGPGLLLQAGPITPTRRRDVPLSFRQSGRSRPTLPKLLRADDVAVDPRQALSLLGGRFLTRKDQTGVSPTIGNCDVPLQT